MTQMRINKLLFSVALLSSVWTTAGATDIATNTARMQAMDKITGRVSEIDVPVNAPVKFGSFSILVRQCMTRPPEETPENTAFVDIVDDYNLQEPVNIFKGWMMSSTTALNAVEHPIYDVWLLKCFDQDNKNVKKLSTEELAARDEIIMLRDQDSATDEAETPKTEETASSLDEVIKATIAQEDTLPEQEQPITQTPAMEAKPEIVVTAPSEELLPDSDAPVALFQIQQQAEPAAEPVLQPVPEPEPIAAESAQSTTAPEVINLQATEQGIEEPAPAAMSETPAVQDRLISFEDEIDEENGYDLEADALAPQ